MPKEEKKKKPSAAIVALKKALEEARARELEIQFEAKKAEEERLAEKKSRELAAAAAAAAALKCKQDLLAAKKLRIQKAMMDVPCRALLSGKN